MTLAIHLIPASLPCAALSRGGSEGASFFFHLVGGPEPSLPRSLWLLRATGSASGSPSLSDSVGCQGLWLGWAVQTLGGEPQQNWKISSSHGLAGQRQLPRRTGHSIPSSQELTSPERGGARSGPTTESESVTSQGRGGLCTGSPDLEGSLWAGRSWEGRLGRWERGGGAVGALEQETTRGQGGGPGPPSQEAWSALVSTMPPPKGPRDCFNSGLLISKQNQPLAGLVQIFITY